VGLIDDEELWVKMLLDRNMTSPTYNEQLADEIYSHIKSYVPAIKKLLSRIGHE
jgi:nucleotidyltransferase substrate binding protein (TIGR01987 family)